MGEFWPDIEPLQQAANGWGWVHGRSEAGGPCAGTAAATPSAQERGQGRRSCGCARRSQSEREPDSFPGDPNEYRADRDIVLAAARQDGLVLPFVAEALRGDKEIALAAVKENADALRHASAEMQADRGIVLAVARQIGSALRNASGALQDDPDVVRAAVLQQGMALQYASVRLRADPTVVLTAVQRAGKALRFASEALRDDSDVVLAAVLPQGIALKHASRRLRADFMMVLAAIQPRDMLPPGTACRLVGDGMALQCTMENDQGQTVRHAGAVFTSLTTGARLTASSGANIAITSTLMVARKFASTPIA